MRGPAPSLQRGKYVALMRIEGTIIDGRSGRLPVQPPIDIPLVGEDRAGDLSVVQLARQVAADKRAAAVVLYVNSRGGSSTASVAMYEALATIAARKPLVVVMGSVAGSGGYLVSMPGLWIIARPGTLTGSIGVLTGKLVTSGLWEKLTATRETISLGKHATIESDAGPFSPEERSIVEAQVARRRFIEGDQFTIADIALGAFARRWFGVEGVTKPKLPNLERWFAQISERAGFKQFIDAIATPFLAPFKGLMPTPGVGSFRLMLSYIVALAVYVLLHMAVNGLFRLVVHRKTAV